MRDTDFSFTSESVAAGHPDKLCDQISDSILDAILEREEDPRAARGAIEVLATTQHVTIAGEYHSTEPMTTEEIEAVTRRVIRENGFTDPHTEFEADNCSIDVRLHRQSPEIAEMVDVGGAGDQGLMFGYARRDNADLMPAPIWAAHRLIESVDALRTTGQLAYLRPDGKSQVTVRYAGGKPVGVEKIVIAVPHEEKIAKDRLIDELFALAVQPLLDELALPFHLSIGDSFIVNGTGDWFIGGPHSDTGLTGRKIIVDSYGGWGRHGGGAFSGKDPTKVDRSAAYMCRHVAKSIVAAGLARECEVQVAYVIGADRPLSLFIDTRGTGAVPDAELEKLVAERFDFKPGEIRRKLDLWRPIYRKTATYGHFGRSLPEFTWEQVTPLS